MSMVPYGMQQVITVSYLKIGQMIGEPVDKAIETCLVHRINSLIEQLRGLGQHLRHGAGLQLAQLDQYGTVGNL